MEGYSKARLTESVGLKDICSESGAILNIVEDEDYETTPFEYMEEPDQYRYQLHLSDHESDEDTGDDFSRLTKKMQDITPEKDGGLLKLVKEQGVGLVVPPESRVTIHFTCRTENADCPYDSSRLRGHPESHRIGEGSDLFYGMNLAIQSMRRKEKSWFLIRPDYAYGEMGVEPRIPGNSVVLMEIELLNFTDVADCEDFFSLTREEQSHAPFKVVHSAVFSLKDNGKEHFQNQRYELALRKYMRALNILENHHLQSEDEERTQRRLLARIYVNVAQCATKPEVNKPKLAIKHVNNFLHLPIASENSGDEHMAKAFLLKGRAQRQLCDFDGARKSLSEAARRKPTDTVIARELTLLNSQMKQSAGNEVLMARKMLGNTDPIPDENDPLRERSENELKRLADKCGEENKKSLMEILDHIEADPKVVSFPLSNNPTYTQAEYAFTELYCKQLPNVEVQKTLKDGKVFYTIARKRTH